VGHVSLILNFNEMQLVKATLTTLSKTEVHNEISTKNKTRRTTWIRELLINILLNLHHLLVQFI